VQLRTFRFFDILPTRKLCTTAKTDGRRRQRRRTVTDGKYGRKRGQKKNTTSWGRNVLMAKKSWEQNNHLVDKTSKRRNVLIQCSECQQDSSGCDAVAIDWHFHGDQWSM